MGVRGLKAQYSILEFSDLSTEDLNHALQLIDLLDFLFDGHFSADLRGCLFHQYWLLKPTLSEFHEAELAELLFVERIKLTSCLFFICEGDDFLVIAENVSLIDIFKVVQALELSPEFLPLGLFAK